MGNQGRGERRRFDAVWKHDKHARTRLEEDVGLKRVPYLRKFQVAGRQHQMNSADLAMVMAGSRSMWGETTKFPSFLSCCSRRHDANLLAGLGSSLPGCNL